MSTLPFYKMQATGNDFVVLNALELGLGLNDIIELTPKLCDRRYGVGGDGVLALSKSKYAEAEYEMIYRNSDGSDAGMCGNGSRCLALFAHEMTDVSPVHRFHVKKYIYRARLTGERSVEVSFPFEPEVKSRNTPISSISEQMYQTYPGTEHIVMLPISAADMQNRNRLIEEGARLRNHNEFHPKGTNVNFVMPLEEEQISLRTYERGVEGLTLACGTGAIASALTWHTHQSSYKNENHYKVDCDGGQLQVKFNYNSDKKRYSHILLEGPAHFVFNGQIDV